MGPPGSDAVVKALVEDGFHSRGRSGGGSHQVFRKEMPEGTRMVVVPLAKKEIPKGTFGSILRQAGPTAKHLEELIRRARGFHLHLASPLKGEEVCDES